MAAVNPPKYSKKEVSQSFNLKELLGYSPTQRQKKLFFELAVDRMVDRTLRGQDINGSAFTPYTEEYAEKKGVPRSSVDLTLTGDMLSSFEESQPEKDVVKIQIDEDETGKAYGHISGFKGHKSIKNGPVRNFFGLKEDAELARIVREVDVARGQFILEAQEELETIDLAALRRAVSSVTIEFEDFQSSFDGQD